MKHTILKNGLKYVLNHNNNKYTVNLLLCVRVGSRNEEKGYYGMAHYFEHLLFKGTKRFPNSKLISDRIYNLGGEINAYTSYDVTVYYLTINSKYIDIGLDVLSDIFYNSKFYDYEMEKNVVINENKKYKTNPKDFIYDKFLNLIYKNTDLEHPIIGINSQIKRMKMKNIKYFYDKFYTSDRCVLGISGKIPSNINKKIKKYFNKNKKTKKTKTKEDNKLINYKDIQKKTRIKIYVKKILQSQVYLGFPCYDDNDNYNKYVLKIISVVLGENMSSRLFVSVREKRGLVYTIKSYIDSNYDNSHIFIYFGCNNSNVKLSLKLILDELKKIKKNGLTKKEIDNAIEYIIGQEEVSEEDNEICNINNTYCLTFDIKKKSLKDEIKIYKKIKNNDIIKVANDIFQNNKLNVCAVLSKNIKNIIPKSDIVN